MALNLNDIYLNLLGRSLQSEGDTWQDSQAYWTNQYDTAIANNMSAADARAGVIRDIGASQEGGTDYAKVAQTLSANPDIVQKIDQNDLHGLGATDSYVDENKWNTMMGNFGTLQNSFTSLQETLAKNQKDMMDMYGSGPWGGGGGSYGQTVGGVKTANELPGYAPKKGGSAGFFGRGGNRFGLSTSSLNI